MEVTMKMTGARELEELMVRELPPAFGRRAMIGGMKKAAVPMVEYASQVRESAARLVEYAKARVAYQSGALQHSIGIQTLRFKSDVKTPLGEPAVAWLRLGPLSGSGKTSGQAYLIYKAHYNEGKIDLKRGAPIGRIRHGHLVEWGFTMRDGRKYPGRPFMTPAATVMGKVSVDMVVAETRKKVEASIKRHNAKAKKK